MKISCLSLIHEIKTCYILDLTGINTDFSLKTTKERKLCQRPSLLDLDPFFLHIFIPVWYLDLVCVSKKEEISLKTVQLGNSLKLS